jgi:type I restriction enzyme S subunit
MELTQESAETMGSVVRKTNLSSMPEEWDAIPLGDICDFSNGVNANKEAYGSGVPFVNVLEVVENTHIGLEDIPGRVEIPQKIQRKYSVESGDILFNRTSETREEVGLAAVYEGEEPVVFGGFVIRARMKRKVMDAQFAGYALRAPLVRKQIASSGQGAIRANISQKELSKVEVPVPPPEEQEAIKEALSDIDTLLSSIDKAIEKKRKVKTATMQRLLTGEERLAGFDGEWEVRQLGGLVDIVNGGTPDSQNKKYWGGNVQWCTPTDITESSGKYLNETERQLTEEGLNSSSAQLLPAGALLLCSRATVGEVKIASREIATNQGFKALVCGPEIDNHFLYYVLLTKKGDMIEKSYGSTFLEMPKRATASLEITLPSLDEQRAIVEILSDMDAEIEAWEKRRVKTEAVKKGVMQELLTGRTRLA